MLEPIDPIESFRPDANARCVCGKKDLFKNCCGSSAVDREIPAEIMIAKSFLPSVTCDKLVKFVSTEADSSDLAVFVSSANDQGKLQGKCVRHLHHYTSCDWTDVKCEGFFRTLQQIIYRYT